MNNVETIDKELQSILLSKKISIEKVSEETKISKKYLIAIEEDDYTVFPARIYLVGFIKMYAHYLGLDYDQILRNFNNQEQGASSLSAGSALNAKIPKKKEEDASFFSEH